jgi:sulfoxide reductase catalytic subunit YedY
MKIDRSEITPEALYASRRAFMKRFGALAVGSLAVACGAPTGGQAPASDSIAPAGAPTDALGGAATPALGGAASPAPTVAPEAVATDTVAGDVVSTVDELGDALTSFEDITNYNNYYEFSTNKQAVAVRAEGFQTSPWQLEVGGLVRKPRTFDLAELMAFEQEERVYRLRCVEGWSMVIPWLGFPLHKLLAEVEPTAEAKFVSFQSVHDPEALPGQGNNWFPWPYMEGLRLDEAMNDLAILATGLYGKPLPPQDGAPIRLVVPWKYGFKSAKALVRIDLVAKQPATFWSQAAPNEYGFYANVNPDVPHPRWSQASERRIGAFRRRRTLKFNGYEDQVASLYEGMDLKANF